MTRRLHHLIALLLLCLPPGLACGAGLPAVQLQPSMEQQLIYDRMEYLLESELHYSLESVLAMDESRFSRPHRGLYNFPLNDHDYWFRFSTHNPEDHTLAWLLELNLEFIDRVNVYAFSDNGMKRHYHYDVKQGHSPGFSRHRHPLLRLESEAGEQSTYYIHLERDRVAPISPSSLRIWSADQFQKQLAQEYIAFGVFYGGMLVAVLYNLMLFISIRSMNHLYYVLYILIACTSWFTQNGLGYQYLWHDTPFMIDYSASLLALGSALAGSVYTRNFLETAKRAPLLDRYILGVIGGSLFSILLMPFLPLATFNLLGYLMVAMGVSAYPFFGAYVWYRGYKPARLFTVAWFFFGFGTLAFVLVHMGVLPNVAPFTVAGQVGNWIEAILLSIALADRLNLIQRESNEAKLHYHQMLINSKDELERQVTERTAELTQAKEDAERLARTDTLTGLPNRRCFFEHARAELLRSHNFGHPLSLFILDIDHFKSINDRHGHALGDQALQVIAEAIRESLRDTDIIGRIGGEEFAAVLPQSGTDTGHEVAERLRQRIGQIELLAGGERVNLSASIGLATLREKEALDRLMARADELLYQAKSSGRNRVLAAV